ncbi:T9SS type A sorting domain-containing protein [Candidatus Neomarinimicrobiota bacterium]
MRSQLIIMLSVAWVALAPGLLPAQAPPDSLIIYSNSFETPEDTSGWIGLGSWMFVDDPAPDEGTRSLLIGGGCIQPAAWIDVPCTTGDGPYRLSFWGNTGLITPYGGYVLVGPADPYSAFAAGIEVHVDSLNWHYYQAEGELSLGGIDTLRIQILIGGIVYDDMQIDGLEIAALSTLGMPADTRTPIAFNLESACPNPFNPATTLRYSLTAPGPVLLRVYDLVGHEVATLAEGYQPAGEYELSFVAHQLPSGHYFARLAVGSHSQSIKLVLLK